LSLLRLPISPPGLRVAHLLYMSQPTKAIINLFFLPLQKS